MKNARRHIYATHHRALLATYDLKKAPAVFGYSRAPYLSPFMLDWRPYESYVDHVGIDVQMRLIRARE